ncbi:MAG TPA: flagellar basal body-associated FliL family protein [Deltaproteobacteria bacterium]|nr:flagellar basal body-associated FliL family protein [Deltaproteobacteria bacterium]
MATENAELKKEKEEAGRKKKKFPLKVIVIVLVVVLLLGGAAAGYFLFLSPKMKSEGEGPAAKETHQGKESAQAASAAGPMKALDPFIVNLSDADGSRYLKAVMQLELDNAELDAEVTAKMPQVRDEILTLLSSKTYDDVSTVEGKRILKREIMGSVNRYLTTGQVVQVYFSDFVVQ